MSHDTVFQIYAVCASILVLNLLLLAFGTAAARSRAGKILNPEDRKLNQQGELQAADDGDVARFRRAHLNALENIPTFLIMGFLLVLTRPSVVVAGALFGTFTVFRLVHTVAYLKGLQPLRTIAFAIAMLAQISTIAVFLAKALTA